MACSRVGFPLIVMAPQSETATRRASIGSIVDGKSHRSCTTGAGMVRSATNCVFRWESSVWLGRCPNQSKCATSSNVVVPTRSWMLWPRYRSCPAFSSTLLSVVVLTAIPSNPPRPGLVATAVVVSFCGLLPVSGIVVDIAHSLLYHVSAHILQWIIKFNLFRDGHAIMRQGGDSKPIVNRNMRPRGPGVYLIALARTSMPSLSERRA